MSGGEARHERIKRLRMRMEARGRIAAMMPAWMRRSREYLERLDRETMAQIRRIAAEGREGDRP